MEPQVTYNIWQAKGDSAVEDVCRSPKISQFTLCIWMKKYGNLAVSQVCRLDQLKNENPSLKGV